MARKANLNTIRGRNKSLSFFNCEGESSKLLHGLKMLKAFQRVMKIRNVLVTTNCLDFVGNIAYITLGLFFKASKIIKYRRKLIKKRKPKNRAKKEIKLITFMKREIRFLQSNVVSFKIVVLNRKVDEMQVTFLTLKLRSFLNALFSRRSTLFLDVIRATSLFVDGRLSTQSYLEFLGLIFKGLQKKSHSKFILFVKELFNLIILDSEFKRFDKSAKLKGVKFVLNGKLKGKPRASSLFVSIGSVPESSIIEDIVYSRLSVHTLYGVYGLKMWAHRVY
jgi:hypothetical protein